MEVVNKEKTVLPKLKNLGLKELPLLYGASGAVDLECPSLEHLIVVDCAHIPFSITFSLFHSFESWSRLSFSTSTSDYFGSTYLVQLNPIQLYSFLRHRVGHLAEAANPIGKLCWIVSFKTAREIVTAIRGTLESGEICWHAQAG